MRSEKIPATDFRTGVQLPSSPLKPGFAGLVYLKTKNADSINQRFTVRSTGLEPVPIAGHAPQTCAYADSATTANNRSIIRPALYFVKKN